MKLKLVNDTYEIGRALKIVPVDHNDPHYIMVYGPAKDLLAPAIVSAVNQAIEEAEKILG